MRFDGKEDAVPERAQNDSDSSKHDSNEEETERRI
jgi:hypothetical protein